MQRLRVVETGHMPCHQLARINHPAQYIYWDALLLLSSPSLRKRRLSIQRWRRENSLRATPTAAKVRSQARRLIIYLSRPYLTPMMD